MLQPSEGGGQVGGLASTPHLEALELGERVGLATKVHCDRSIHGQLDRGKEEKEGSEKGKGEWQVA